MFALSRLESVAQISIRTIRQLPVFTADKKLGARRFRAVARPALAVPCEAYAQHCFSAPRAVREPRNLPVLLALPARQRRANVMTTAAGKKLEFEVVDIENPKEYNFILGHAHFIKTVEDLYEALVQSSTALKFGIAFNEASPGYEAMPGRKVRFDGNSEELIELAKKNAMALGAGHTFIVFLDGGFPVNCLNAVKNGTEVLNSSVCRIHCATSNPTSVVLAKTSDDAVGIMGVIDGVRPTDFETDDDKKKRHEFLRMIGYKR